MTTPIVVFAVGFSSIVIALVVIALSDRRR